MPRIREADRGTPLRRAPTLVSLEIDGAAVTVPAGVSVMHAAAQAGVRVPGLCATDCLEPVGSCRLCLVEIDGRRGYPSSCTTVVEAGMKVRTETPRLTALRRNVLELLLADHPTDCLTCAANGDCELQRLAARLGVRQVRYEAGDRPAPTDDSNPYFAFDPERCVLCTRCMRACREIQGNFALGVAGRGYRSRIVPGVRDSFMDSDCVACGACVQVCPTGALMEKTVGEHGQPDRTVTTTCAYCGVGCALKVDVQGPRVVRVLPADGPANRGHACVKGRFAWGYATHRDRVTRPMIRARIQDPWREVSWEEALAHAAAEFRRIQATHGTNAVGGIASSRCTNEETYLVQKLVRAAFGNNNVDNCARVCHAPTGYGLLQTLGEAAGTQSFDSVTDADVIMVVGSNPTDAHPVVGARMKRRLRQGAKLILVDPRRTDLLGTPHVDDALHLQLKPGTNVALLNALAHVIVSEGLTDEAFVAARCDVARFEEWKAFVASPENAPEAVAAECGVPAEAIRAAARLYATAGNAAIYYGLGVTEHSQGSTGVMAIANLALATGNIGREGVGVNPLRGQNNVQGSCDMGCFPNVFPGYRSVADATIRAEFEAAWGVALSAEPGLRIPQMFDAAVEGRYKGLYCQGEDIAQSDPNSGHVKAALEAMECVVVQDLFLNETAKYAHVFLPGSTFLEKNGTFTNGERRISPVRKVVPAPGGKEDWEITQALANALGYPMAYGHPREIMDEIASMMPTHRGVSHAKVEALGSVQWPCNEQAPEGTPTMHRAEAGGPKLRFCVTPYVPTPEQASGRFPLILTTGRILVHYNVGAQTRRTDNVAWHAEDSLEIHPADAASRRIGDGDWVTVRSRTGQTRLRARLSERVQPGVVYTTFHFPECGTNAVTTDNGDWATSCPEYKVTAVEVEGAEVVRAEVVGAE